MFVPRLATKKRKPRQTLSYLHHNVVFLFVLFHNGACYARQILKLGAKLKGEQISAGGLYPILRRMVEERLIYRSVFRKGSKDRRRKYYVLTKRGKLECKKIRKVVMDK